MFNGKYISINEIINKVYRDMGMADQINFGDAVEWAGEAIDIIGAPFHLIEKVRSVRVEHYKAEIPCDLHYIITISGKETTLEDIEDESCDAEKLCYIPMRYSTDTFHHWYCKHSNDCKCLSDYTYKVNDNFLFTNFKEGRILISYKAIPVDDNGYPKIPDDPKFKEAVAGQIKWRLAFIKVMEGKMQEGILNKIERDRDWYIGAAQTRAQMPSIDMAESLKNNWLRLIPKINQHADGFKSAGHREER